MSNRQGISIIADIDACKQNAKEVREILKTIETDIVNFPKIIIDYKKAEGLPELKKVHEQLADITKKNIDLTKQLEASNQKLVESENKLAAAREKASKDRKKMNDEELRAELAKSKASQDKQKELKKEIELQEAANGSIEKARAIVNDLTLKRNKLNLETEEGRKKLAEYNVEIDRQNDFIKKNVDALARQKINIGNYPESAKMIVEALERQRERAERLNKELGNTHPAAQQATRGMEALQRIVDQPQFLNVAAKVGDSNAELKSFTKTLIELDRQGLGKSDFAIELRKHLAELKDSIEDTRGEIKRLSSDSHAFDEFANSISFVASSYQTLAGAQELFGEQNEDVEQSIKRLVAIQNVSNGVQQIAKQLTEDGTFVNKAYVAIQNLFTAATDRSAAATTRLNAAFKLSTIGLVIGAVALLITKWNDWFGTSKKVLDQQKALDDYNTKIANSYVEQKQSLDGLVDKLKDQNTKLSEKKEIVKQLQETYPSYLGNLKIEKGEVVGLAEGYSKLTQAIALKARSQATGELLAEQEKELLKQGLQIGITSFEQADKLYDKYKDSGNTIYNIFLNAYQGAKATRAELLKLKTDADKALQSLGGDPTGGQGEFKDQKKKQEDAAKQAEEIAKRNLKAKFDLYKLEKEKQLEHLQEIIDDEKAGYGERILAAMNYVEVKQSLIRDIAAFEKKTTKATKDEIALIDKQSLFDQIKVAEDIEKKMSEISERAKDKKAASATEIFVQAPTENPSSWYKQLSKAVDDYGKKQAEIAEKEKQYHQERKERLNELASQVKETTAAIIEAGFEKQKNALQARQDLNDKSYEREVENVRNSTLTEEDKANRLKVLEAEHVAQKEQSDRKIRAIDEKKARFDRAKNIADIIQSTSVAIVKTLAAYPGPAGVALSFIEGAIGAAALVRAVATQIPKYFMGRSKYDPYEGRALAGEYRPELLKKKDGSMQIIDKPTIIDVERGDEILPEVPKSIMPFAEMQNGVVASAFRSMLLTSIGSNDIVSKKLDQIKLENKEMLIWQTGQLKEAYKSKQPINISISNFKNSDYINESVRN